MNTDSQIAHQTVDLKAAVSPDTIKPQLASLQRAALIAAVIGLVLSGIGALAGMDKFLQSYLTAYLFWFGLTAGGIGILMLHNTVGGGWGFIIRRPVEAATRTLPLLALLFVPIGYSAFMGDASIFSWVHSAAATDQILIDKALYLNPSGFAIRAFLYFVIWGIFTFFLNKWSRVLDERADEGVLQKLNITGAFGILIHITLITFMSVDWAMSLEPHWFSSIYGCLFLAGQMLSTLALMCVVAGTMGMANPLTKLVPDKYFRDLGNLMMVGVLVWAYCAFSQYLLQYSGNIAEDASWYATRRVGGWGIIGLALVFLHFALPFAVLLSSLMKTKPQNLAKIAGFILFMRWVDLFYLTRPTFAPTLMGGLHIADIGLFLLMGGVWLWVWAEQLKKAPLVPLYDPRFSEHWALEEHERLEAAKLESLPAHPTTEVKSHV